MHHKRIRQESSPILHLTLQIFVQTLQASDSHHSMIVFGKACNFYHQFAILEYHPEKEDGTYNTYEHQSRI
jgi:hypothetical protein